MSNKLDPINRTVTSTPPTSTTPTPTQLPAILCLHGGGSTSTVFKIQARRLIWNLSSQFRFIFIQGPIESAPGHGMLPVFESCAPFARWVIRTYINATPTEIEYTPREEVEVVDEIIRNAMIQNGGIDSFVGVMGFSMGAKMVAGLLHRQLVENRKSGGDQFWTKFKFGVMIGGPYPGIGLYDEKQGIDVDDYQLLRTIPTVHAWGRDDHLRGGCRKMMDVCDGDGCFQMDFEGGHHMPLTDGEARDLCDLIRGAYYAGGGKFVVGGGEKY